MLAGEQMSYSEEDCAKKQAFLHLSRRSLFVEELTKKLLHKGFSQEAVDKAVSLCVQKGFLDDHKLTRQLVEQARGKGFGSKAIWFKLHGKVGINQTVLRKIIAETEKNQLADLKKLLQKKSQQTHLLDPRKKRQVIAKCLRRGYSYEEIMNCLAE
jgi:SOS response regulatory protein OraA/RecX